MRAVVEVIEAYKVDTNIVTVTSPCGMIWRAAFLSVAHCRNGFRLEAHQVTLCCSCCLVCVCACVCVDLPYSGNTWPSCRLSIVESDWTFTVPYMGCSCNSPVLIYTFRVTSNERRKRKMLIARGLHTVAGLMARGPAILDVIFTYISTLPVILFVVVFLFVVTLVPFLFYSVCLSGLLMLSL